MHYIYIMRSALLVLARKGPRKQNKSQKNKTTVEKNKA